MKKILVFGVRVFALLMAVTSITTQSVSAQATVPGRFVTAHYSLLISACNVNGVTYSVDSNLRIWAVNAWGQPLVIGYIEFGPPTGYIAVRLDGVTFPAYCQ
jgi:hypothetical protein